MTHSSRVSELGANALTLRRLTTPYSGRTAPLTSKSFILYIYSSNIGTEYLKRCIYCPFFPLQNAVFFIILTYLVPGLFTFCIQGVLKLKKNNSGDKRLNSPFFPLQNAVCFIILTYLVPVLLTFYIQGVLKFKK